MIRSVLVTMTMFAGGPPRRVFSDAEPGLAWLAGELGLDPKTTDAIRGWSSRAKLKLPRSPP